MGAVGYLIMTDPGLTAPSTPSPRLWIRPFCVSNTSTAVFFSRVLIGAVLVDVSYICVRPAITAWRGSGVAVGTGVSVGAAVGCGVQVGSGVLLGSSVGAGTGVPGNAAI